MFTLKRLRLALRHTRLPDPTALWERVLVLAVTDNPYPIAIKIRVLLDLKLGEYRSLMDWADAMTHTKYGSPDEHFRMHQLAALIRKYPLPDAVTGYTPDATARATFAKAEHRCKRYNQRLAAVKRTGRDRDGTLFYHMRGFIMSVLGPSPNLQQIFRSCDITGGAAIGVHGNATNVARKLSAERWTVSPRAFPYALAAIRNNFHMVELLLAREGQQIFCIDYDKLADVVRERVSWVCYNKLSFVPKTAKTSRSIAVEPFLNSFLEKGIDTIMRRKLLKIGLDLRRQEPNQELARRGSVEVGNPYCTIDLSSASDTIASDLVLELVPPEWGDLLDAVRCHYYEDEGVIRKYHKFVSMGNGFCFPLQTLIFASVCHAAAVMRGCVPDYRVYGDDIIVRKEIFDDVMLALDRLGFLPNSRKTFSEGPFRESCGTDWFAGVNVRPIYIDKPLNSWERIYGLHNQSLRRENHVRNYFRTIREVLFETVPSAVRLCSYVDPGVNSANDDGVYRLSTEEPEIGADNARFQEYFPSEPVLTRPGDRTTNEAAQVAASERWYRSREICELIDGAFWVPEDVFMAGRYTGWNRWTQSWKYVVLHASASIDSRYRPVGRDDSLIYLIGALRGSDSARPFTLRYSTQMKPRVINDDSVCVTTP
jgi:hypothetical protein